MYLHIPGWGNPHSKILAVGEAPGRDEDRLGYPFAGPSGHKLNTFWREAGLRREDFYLDNLYQYRPNEHNDIHAVELAVLEEWAHDLHRRVAELPALNLIVPIGNMALRALMRASLRDEKVLISKYRGSVMEYRANDGRLIKMIPTIHPASIYHQKAKKSRGQEKTNPGRTEKHCRGDWRRIAEESKFPELNLPTETNYIIESESELAWFLEEFRRLDSSTIVTVDIETVSGGIDCVGFGWDDETSFTLPLRDPRTPWLEELGPRRIAAIREVCESPNPKNLQNGAFDYQWLRKKENIVLRNFIYDTSWMHHALDPVDDHDLAYMQSVFIRTEYHKDEAKRPDAAQKYASHYEAYMTYNGKDITRQHRLRDALEERLRRVGRWDYYLDQYAKLAPAWLAMMEGGISVDRKKRAVRHVKLTLEIMDIQDRLTELAGEPLIAKKDFSPIKLKKFLYETLKLPVQRKRGKRGVPGPVTTDEVALRKLQISNPEKCGTAILDLLGHRRRMKLLDFLRNDGVDEDDRIRCEYQPLQEACRLSSKENPFGTGDNLANQDREVRDTFIPDVQLINGRQQIFLEVDCSQAESRLVYLFSGDKQLYQLACTDPGDFDTHSFNAFRIFGGVDEQTKYLAKDLNGNFLGYVTFEQRYFGKRVEHGCVDPETEVLTRRGFVRFDELTKWDNEIAQWDYETGVISFVQPSEWVEYDYEGTMYRFRNGFLSQFVTPNHRIVYESNGTTKVREAHEAPHDGKVPLNGLYSGPLAIDHDLVRVIVVVQADATIRPDGSLLWNLKKINKINRLLMLLKFAKIPHKIAQYGNDGITRITVNKIGATSLIYWLRDKSFSEKLLQWDGASLDVLLDELAYWDGENRGGAILYRSTDRESVNWVQTIAHLRGRKASVTHQKPSKGSFGKKGCYHVSISHIKTSRLGYRHASQWSGKVYCVTVPAGFFVIRRNGCVSVTGNSQRGLGGKKMSDELLKDEVLRSPEECDRTIERYFIDKPGVREYFAWIQQLIIRHGGLANDWGGYWDVTHEKKDDDLYRRAFSYKPQADVALLLSSWGLYPAWRYLEDLKSRGEYAGRVCATVYDSVLTSIDPMVGYDLMVLLRESLMQEKEYVTRVGRATLRMPVEFKIGLDWSMNDKHGRGVEFKKFPSRSEYEEAVEKLGVSLGSTRRSSQVRSELAAPLRAQASS